jgi:hypothetical protein
MALAISLTASPALAAALARSGGAPERGIDISAYQNANGPIDWRELASRGIRFVAIKASEDTYYTNPYYLAGARAALRAGLSVLAYAFANPDRAGGAATAGFAVGPRTTDGQPAAPSSWTRWSFWQYSENGYLPGIGWTDLDVFQSASGFPSLRPAWEPKPSHRQKRRSKHKPKHEKPKNRQPKWKHNAKPAKRSKRVRKGKHLPVTNRRFSTHTYQSH